jgi:hypothetical protein
LPGDLVCLSFDVKGFQMNSAGKIHYGVGLEVADSKGELLFKNAPSDIELLPSTSSELVPMCAKVDIGLAAPPGKYDLKVTVLDRTTATTTSLTRSYEVLPLEFALVRVSLSRDLEGKTSAAVFSPGQPAWINFSAVGFGRDKDKGQPHLTATLRIVDEANRPVYSKPLSGTITQDVPVQVGAVPMQFQLVLPQSGRFTVELAATDAVTGRNTAVRFPIQVAASK